MEAKRSVLDDIPSRYEIKYLLERYKNVFTKEQYEYLVKLYELDVSVFNDSWLSEEVKLDLLRRDTANEESLYLRLARYNIAQSAIDMCLSYAADVRTVRNHSNNGFNIFVSGGTPLGNRYIPVFGYSFPTVYDDLSTGATEIDFGTITLFQAVKGKMDGIGDPTRACCALESIIDNLNREGIIANREEIDYYTGQFDRLVNKNLTEEKISNKFFQMFLLLYGLPEDWCSITDEEQISDFEQHPYVKKRRNATIEIIRY